MEIFVNNGKLLIWLLTTSHCFVKDIVCHKYFKQKTDNKGGHFDLIWRITLPIYLLDLQTDIVLTMYRFAYSLSIDDFHIIRATYQKYHPEKKMAYNIYITNFSVCLLMYIHRI